jgi:hypothetical protein
MTYSKKPLKQLGSVGSSTAHQLSITFASVSYGQLTLNETLNPMKSQSVWRSSKSHAYKSRTSMRTVTWTAQVTLQSLDKLLQLIGQTLTVTKAANGVWCDYCKLRWGNERRLIEGVGTVPRDASYTVISQNPKSKGINRNYCRNCAAEVSEWTDGEVWTIAEQAQDFEKYIYGKEMLPNV